MRHGYIVKFLCIHFHTIPLLVSNTSFVFYFIVFMFFHTELISSAMVIKNFLCVTDGIIIFVYFSFTHTIFL